MKTTGVKAIAEIEEVVRRAYLRNREFKALKRRAAELIKKFPKDEKDIYQERINSATKRLENYGKVNSKSSKR